MTEHALGSADFDWSDELFWLFRNTRFSRPSRNFHEKHAIDLGFFFVDLVITTTPLEVPDTPGFSAIEATVFRDKAGNQCDQPLTVRVGCLDL